MIGSAEFAVDWHDDSSTCPLGHRSCSGEWASSQQLNGTVMVKALKRSHVISNRRLDQSIAETRS